MKSVVVFLAVAMVTQMVYAAPKVAIENIKVVVTEKNKKPTTVKMPYWFLKEGVEIAHLLPSNYKEVPVKSILKVVEKAPQLGHVMTIENDKQKIVISIE